MRNVADRVLVESRRFYQALPRLLASQRGRWVVFRDGTVHSSHPERDVAYAAAVRAFGIDGAFVVAEVREPVPATIRWP